MITPGIMEILHESIQIYDKLCGKSYLIVFGSKTDWKFIQVKIKQSSFWHLLGCSLEPDSNDGKNNTYLQCKERMNVSDKISSIHSFSEIKKKYLAMQNVFDFVTKANEIKIGYAVNCPEEYLFKVGTGNNTGIIGYDYPNIGNSDSLFPKSAQLKTISKISNTTYRILMILSKNIGEKYYHNIEYEIKKDIYSNFKEHIPNEINVRI